MADTPIDLSCRTRGARNLGHIVGPVLHDLRKLFELWAGRRRHRDELRRLLQTAPHMVPDIGIPLDEARFEIDKPFWRA